MRRVAGFLLVASFLISVSSPARAAPDLVIGLWPQTLAQSTAIQAASGISIPYFRGRMRDGQFDTQLAPPDDRAAAAAGYSIGMNIQPKTGSGATRTGILYTDISAQIEAASGPYYDKLVSMADEVLALPTYGVVPNYIEFHSEANIQAAPNVASAHPYSGTGPEYQQCYALIHQLFDSLGVTDKIYWQIVLTRSAYIGLQGGPQNWYPSDPSLYDLVGVDAYYQSPGWLSPTSAFDTAFAWGQAQGKPVWIDETGADEGGPTGSATAKAEWFGALGGYLEAHRRSLAGIVFSHSSDQGNWFLDSQLAGGRADPNYTGISWTGWVAAVTHLVAFVPVRTLSVTTAGTGDGAVASSPPGIDCGTTCSADYPDDTVVTLSAAPSDGSVFGGWSGGGCAGAATTCDVTMGDAQNVTATFTLARHTLTITTSGTGTGSVASDDGGITCGASCSADYDHGTVVVLSAAPDANVTFVGWGGGGCSGTADCTIAIDAATSVNAEFDLAEGLLSVVEPGNGDGTVTSDDGGIDCPGVCGASYPDGSAVVLTASAGANSTFSGWSGACGGEGTCTVSMDGAQAVSATFTLDQHSITLTTSGLGAGSITSDVGGIDCPSACSAAFDHGSTAVLHAEPDANSVFAGWGGGGCSGPNDCTITINTTTSVNAQFDLIQRPLTVATQGNGNGSVTSDDADAIDCPGVCDASYAHGTAVVLTAHVGPNTVFTRWGGDCAGAGTTCDLTMDAGKNASAAFALVQNTLSISKTGNGTGTVNSDTGSIDCGVSCTDDYDYGTTVVLTASPDANAIFAGWTGGGCSGATHCSVTIDAAMSVQAQFDLVQHLLTVVKAGNATGTVTSDMGGINCPGTCGSLYPQGSAVVLTPHPGANATFTGWSGGACVVVGTSCNLTMDAAKNTTATFMLVQHTLTVTKAGTGTGSVMSNVGGIACPGTCAFDYDQGTVVALTATPTGGSTFAGWSGGVCTGSGTCSVTLDAAKAVTGTFNPPVITTTLKDDDPAVTYDDWLGVADAAASGGFFRIGSLKNDTITWISPPTTSITWVTRTGPAQGQASVTIDGKTKGVVDLYAPVQASFSKIYAGLANKAHTVVVKVLHTKNPASSNYSVRLDAFVVGGVTTQEFDPKIQYNLWKSTAQALATDGTYRSSATSTASVTVTFTGTSIDWKTAKGKAYGKASVKIDGVSKGTVDLYQTATAWQSLLSYGGLSPGPHTMVIQVLGQKNTKATGKTVVVDGFIVHGS